MTWTPLPTLSGANADSVFRQWLSGTPECRLPCWAGIEPGKTGWAETVHVLSPVLALHPSDDYMKCRFDAMCKYFTWQYQLAGNLYNGVVLSRGYLTIYSISLDGDYSPDLSLQKIFQMYGKPSQVSVLVDTYSSLDTPLLSVTVLYPEDKFVLQYTWLALKKGNIIQACGSPTSFSLGIVDLDAGEWTDLEVEQLGNQMSQAAGGIVILRMLSDVTELTIDQLYEKGLNQSSFCISTPAENWDY
jgi:hypothetical protein